MNRTPTRGRFVTPTRTPSPVVLRQAQDKRRRRGEALGISAVGGTRYGSLAEAWAAGKPLLAELVARQVMRERGADCGGE